MLDIEKSLNQSIQSVSANHDKQTGAFSERMKKLEKLVSDRLAHNISRNDIDENMSLQEKQKALNQRIDRFDEVFSNFITRRVFAIWTIEQLSKAYNPLGCFKRQ